jgi:hypothetical protein
MARHAPGVDGSMIIDGGCQPAIEEAKEVARVFGIVL